MGNASGEAVDVSPEIGNRFSMLEHELDLLNEIEDGDCDGRLC